ncbi:MAG: tRNA (N(6)-L-threonylcarbamoyladenosine(37)-C(2))-methylthiotransferase MtaB [Treponema sp.]|jgi:threonylcarbamoyladenosine tRNA methylthiotransferase MtaB|nr:tRNA (N(6)-L-threonylcarbamoyladenosine(37)-C(2))-methylthiotransferase MtaB [Treponema sp.]
MVAAVHFETLGCRLNQIESESAAHSFSEAGFPVDMTPVSASSPVVEQTLLCIVNTCTVTGKAEQKARRTLRLLLRKYPRAAVVATGCYAQMDGACLTALDTRIVVVPGQRKDLLADIPAFLQSFTGELQQLPAALKNFIRTKIVPGEKLTALHAFRLSTAVFFAHSRASLKIQDGCDNACTYCRIHLARGKSVSLDVRSVLDRVQELERAGQREVVITTVNIAQYRGAYNGTYLDFAGLLALLLNTTRTIAIRLSSLYPEIVDDRLCHLIENPRVRPSFHLSVQSGSDSILAAMNRPYRSEAVRSAVANLRRVKKDPFIACDIIAGFPGETDDDFQATMDLCRECAFTWIHAFPFSPRPDTPAFTMKPRVPQLLAAQRVACLTDFARSSKIAYITSYTGVELEAVAEGTHNPKILSDTASGTLVHAVTENFLHVQFKVCRGGEVPHPGQTVRVRIETALPQNIRRGDEIEAAAVLV